MTKHGQRQDGQKTEREKVSGVLTIDASPGGKRFQGVWLEADDGRKLLLAYRPRERFERHRGQKVVVVGSVEVPDPRAQHITGSHIFGSNRSRAPKRRQLT